MAVSANVIHEVRADGNDANSGCFVRGASGTDRSQQAAAHVIVDGVTITAIVHTTTTQLTITGYTVAATDIGNIYKIDGGSATPGLYQITAVDTANNRWTVDRSVGTALQTSTGRMGGAIASIGQLGANVNSINVANQHAYIRSGTYTLTSSSANVSGGTYDNTSNISCQIIGYNAAVGRTDLSVAPIIDVGAITTVTVFNVTNATASGVAIANVTVDGQLNAAVVGFLVDNTGTAALLCTAIDCVSGFTDGTSPSVRFLACKAAGCTTGFDTVQFLCWRCWADGCTTGFSVGTSSLPTFIDCVASDCGTPFTAGSQAGIAFFNCTSDGATASDGITGTGLGHLAISCVATSASQHGIDFTGSMTFLYGNATFNNTSGATNLNAAQTIEIGAVVLTGDPYVDAAADDYRPDNTSGEGASLRVAGLDIPGQTDSRDIGAVQHTDVGGGGRGSLLRGLI